MLGILTYIKYAPVPALRPPSLTASRYKSTRPLSCTAPALCCGEKTIGGLNGRKVLPNRFCQVTQAASAPSFGILRPPRLLEQ